MSSVKERMARLILSLLEKTNSGKIEWSQAVDKGSFVTDQGGYRTAIWKESNTISDQDDVWIALATLEGEIIDQESDVTLSDAFQKVDKFSFETMNNLYESARASALNISKAIDNILKSIEEL